MRISGWSSYVCSSDLDAGTLETVTQDLQGFIRLERERQGVNERTPNALTINDPEPYRAWSHNLGSHLQSLDQDARNRLTRWLDRLSCASALVPGRTALQTSEGARVGKEGGRTG